MHLLILLFALVQSSSAFAQHLHVQTAYSPNAGWNLFWYDFDAGAFPADAFTQPVTAAARTVIPADPSLTNALGNAGSPVWILPQVEQPGLPSVGFGTQGTGSFQNGQIRLRLVSFNGPGNFAIYSTDPFGGSAVLIATRDGISESDAVVQSFPAGHMHVNWAFTRPGLYELGFRAVGTNSSGETLQSDVVQFRFRVQAPKPPLLKLERSTEILALTVEAETGLPLTVETSTNLSNWTTIYSFATQSTNLMLQVEASGEFKAVRALHPF